MKEIHQLRQQLTRLVVQEGLAPPSLLTAVDGAGGKGEIQVDEEKEGEDGKALKPEEASGDAADAGDAGELAAPPTFSHRKSIRASVFTAQLPLPDRRMEVVIRQVGQSLSHPSRSGSG